jgi:hypothetical protein
MYRMIYTTYSCVISTMCSPIGRFYSVNPSTQLSLYSFCMGNCPTIENVSWNIYQGSMNLSNRNSPYIFGENPFD